MTQRTKNELAILLADNTSGQITPLLMRDLLESVSPSRGALHMLAQGTVDVITQNVAAKVANACELIAGSLRFSMPAAGRLRYDGIVASYTRIDFVGSILAASTDETIAVGIAVNGSLVAESVVHCLLGDPSEPRQLHAAANVTLDPADYVEVFVTNTSSAADVDFAYGYLSALGFLA